MSILWGAKEAAKATGGTARGDWHVSGVSIDTRSIQPGDLFVALKAARDGHEFVAQALAKGAGAALVSHIPADIGPKAPLLLVEDVLEALEALAQAARARMQGKVIAVTGSVGKTSTKEMLVAALSGQGHIHASEKSYNNHWGVPLTLARMPRDTDFAIIEIGMNAPGEIAPLSRLARPHIGIITNVAKAHIGAFGSERKIAVEKASIADGVVADGVMILNRDTKTYPTLDRRAKRLGLRRVRFGMAGRPEYWLRRVMLADNATSMKFRCDGQTHLVKIGASGAHFAQNALAVLAAIDEAGADMGKAALMLARWQAAAGRGERYIVELSDHAPNISLELIDDSYNANPASMEAALNVLAAATPIAGVGRIMKGRRIAVLGDMLELGAAETQEHAALAQLDAIEQIDLIHCVGQRMQALHAALPPQKQGECALDAAALEPMLPRLLDAGDVVMIKGSNASNLSRIVDAIKKMGDVRPQQPTREAL